MRKSYAIFKEYIWLVNTIYKYRRISLEDINKKWRETEMSGGLEFARSTFNRHKLAVEDMFGIYIECDRQNGYKYYIGNANVLEEDTIQNWLLTTLSVNNIISESKGLHSQILLEPIMANNYLQMLIDAMKKSVKINIVYQKYNAQDSKSYTFSPCCLKLFHRRWYVLGYFGEEKYRIFSLDRIVSFEQTTEKLSLEKDFYAEEFFNECFGIVKGDGVACQRIVLRAFNSERYNMRDLPLHKSQRGITEGENYIDYELYLRPTLDFLGHLVSRSSLVKVLEPKWLADEIRDMHKKAAQLYDE